MANQVIRLRPEWRAKLLEAAHPGSDAERCLKGAVYEPGAKGRPGQYVLECDENTMHKVFALADMACPEAIPVMMADYRIR
jgi:hypothetical protein